MNCHVCNKEFKYLAYSTDDGPLCTMCIAEKLGVAVVDSDVKKGESE